MQGHGEGSRRAWEALLNSAENVSESTAGKDLSAEVIPKPTPSHEEIVAKGVADGFERYLIENKGGKKENKKTVKNGNGGRGETWGQYLIKEIKALGAQDVVFDERKDKKVRFSYPDKKGRLQNRLLYLNEVADFIRKQQKRNERVSIEKPPLIKEDSITGQVSASVPEVDMTEAKNPFSISGDLEKSDQGTHANNVASQEDFVVGGTEQPHIEFQSEVGFVLADVDEFETSTILSGEKMYSEEDIVESLESNGGIPTTFNKEKVAKKTEPKEQRFFDTRFETEFGITEEQLSQIEGYERLSEGQRKLVLENVREYARDTREGYLSRAWEGVLKAVGRDVKDKNYIEVVTELIKNTAQFGPKVHEENGELFTDFIDVGIPQQFRKEHKPIFDRFNALAHQYAKMKMEDLEDGIGTHSKDESKFVSFFKNTFSESRRKHDSYESLQESYESAKRALARSLTEMGKSEGEIVEKLVQIDSKVHSLRFLQTEPEAVDIIKQNPDKSFWQKVGEKVFSKENMAYAGLGFVGRMALTGAMGLYAAPVVASAVGGIRSWNKTSAELREKDRMARGGTRDTSKEALNIVDATREIEIGGRKKGGGVTQKLQDLIEKYKGFEYGGGKIEERNSVIESMRARVQYIEDKIKLNRINFGSGSERTTNMANLFETLGEARVLLADIEMPKGSALEARLEQYLVKREGLIQTRRRKKQIKTAVWGTLKAGAFALAGKELAEYVQETGFFSKEESVVGGVAGGTASVPQSAEAPLPKQYGYQAEVRAVDNEIIRKTEALRAEGTEVGTGNVPTEPAPEAESSDVRSSDTPVPSNEAPYTEASDIQTAEELQKMSIENGTESQLHSGEVIEIKDYPPVKTIVANDHVPTKFPEEGVRIPRDLEGGDIAQEQQVGDSSVRPEASPSVEVQPESHDEVIEIKDYPPVKTIVANDHVPTKFPEEGVRIPRDLEGGDIAQEQQVGEVSNASMSEEGFPEKPSVGAEPDVSDVGTPQDRVPTAQEPRVPDYTTDGGTPFDDESSVEMKSTPNTLGSQETFTNTNGVEVDLKREHIYELTGQGGEKVMVSYGGKDFGARFDTAQEYVQKNPEAVVVVEEEPRYGVFGQKLPPSYVEVRNIRGEGVTTIFSIQDDTLPASSEKGIDPAMFTKKVTR